MSYITKRASLYGEVRYFVIMKDANIIQIGNTVVDSSFVPFDPIDPRKSDKFYYSKKITNMPYFITNGNVARNRNIDNDKTTRDNYIIQTYSNLHKVSSGYLTSDLFYKIQNTNGYFEKDTILFIADFREFTGSSGYTTYNYIFKLEENTLKAKYTDFNTYLTFPCKFIGEESNGNLIIAGFRVISSSSFRAYIDKILPNGNIERHDVYNFSFNSSGNMIDVIHLGNNKDILMYNFYQSQGNLVKINVNSLQYTNIPTDNSAVVITQSPIDIGSNNRLFITYNEAKSEYFSLFNYTYSDSSFIKSSYNLVNLINENSNLNGKWFIVDEGTSKYAVGIIFAENETITETNYNRVYVGEITDNNGTPTLGTLRKLPCLKNAEQLQNVVISNDGKKVVAFSKDIVYPLRWNTASHDFATITPIKINEIFQVGMLPSDQTEYGTAFIESIEEGKSIDNYNYREDSSNLYQLEFGEEYQDIDFQYIINGTTYDEFSIITISPELSGNEYIEKEMTIKVKVKSRDNINGDRDFVSGLTIKLTIEGANKDNDGYYFVGYDSGHPEQKTITTTNDWVEVTMKYKDPVESVIISGEIIENSPS